MWIDRYVYKYAGLCSCVSFFCMVCVYVIDWWCFVYFGNIQGLGILICNVDVCG